MAPVFQGDVLCAIIENCHNKTYCLSDFIQISELFACNPYKMCGPVFQGGYFCEIMEKRPHKTHCLSGFVQILDFLACNSFQLGKKSIGPRFWMFTFFDIDDIFTVKMLRFWS